MNKVSQQKGSATISINPDVRNTDGEAIISENPTRESVTGKHNKNSDIPRLKKRKSQGEATISVNPNRPRANASDSKDDSSSSDDSSEIRTK